MVRLVLLSLSTWTTENQGFEHAPGKLLCSKPLSPSGLRCAVSEARAVDFTSIPKPTSSIDLSGNDDRRKTLSLQSRDVAPTVVSTTVKPIRNSQFAIRNYNQWGLEPTTD